MAKGYTVRSVILCDDIREEKSGKEILIGVYTSSIIFGQFPAKMPKLIFRIALSIERADFKRVKAKIVDQDGKQLFSMDQPVGGLPPAASDEQILIGFAGTNLTFQEPAKYRLLFALDDEPEEIARFSVRGPNTDAEASRLV